MRRKIIITEDDQEVVIEVKATVKAMQLYRSEFGSDLSKDLTAIYSALNPDPYADAMKKAGVDPRELTTEELSQKILENMDYTALTLPDPLPDEETQIKTLQIVWAMARTAKKDFPDFETWIDELEMQPIRPLIEQVYDIWQQANKSSVTVKN